jgi:hypothetical protein
MSMADPHVMIIIDTADEMGKDRESSRLFSFSVVFVMWSEPITKPIHFLDGPFTFKRIDSKSAVLEMPEHGAKQLGMILS